MGIRTSIGGILNNEQWFIDKMKRVKELMECNSYDDFTCLTVKRVFGIDTIPCEDYQRFIAPFTDVHFCPTLQELDELTPKLRMLLLTAFEQEILTTKRYLSY